ncbi:MAG: hypothetical protein NTW86_28480 [Candidatus Sumerlaeota bacterium]|nr:hypothetical protein [Candidatus Sumerlaeota bacterium]
MRTKVTFPPNVPQLVDLNDDPILSPGQYGDQYQYILHGERIMWVDPPVHAQIVALGAGRGDTIAITKCVTPSPTGGRAKTAWTVERVEEQPAAPAPPAAAPTRSPALQPPQPAAAMAAALPDDAERWPEIAAPSRRAPQPITAPAPATNPQPANDADALLSALTTAIDVAALAQAHAARRGLPMHFDGADIRALASGLMIERRERSTFSRRAA